MKCLWVNHALPEIYWSIFLIKNITAKSVEKHTLNKKAKEEIDEEDEKTVQAIRKSTSQIIVSDDDDDLEETIEDSSPIKKQVCACFCDCLCVSV